MSSNYFVDLDSNMPVSEDNIDIMEDISIELLQPMRDFENYMAENDLASAAIVLNTHPDLKKCLFNAEKYNKLRDALIATQRTYLGDVKTYLTEAMINKGIYDSNITYYKFNIVSYLDDYYMAIMNSTSGFSNVDPSNTSYWLKMTVRGSQGLPGTGLIPSGTWDENTTYRYYSNNGQYYASMVYFNNGLYQCQIDNISGISNNPTNTTAWSEIMSLETDGNHVITDYGTLNEVLLKTDNFMDIILLNNDWTYEAGKQDESSNNKEFYENIYNGSNIVFRKVSTQYTSNSNWLIQYYVNDGNEDLTIYRSIKLIKDITNNRWLTENVI